MRHQFSEHFLRDGVVLFRFEKPALFARDVLPRVDSYLKPRLARPRASLTQVTGVPLSDPNGTDFSGGSGKRVAFHGYHTLAPADDTVQGPHQEQSLAFRIALVMYCEQPSTWGGDTALFDMQHAWKNLPRDLQLLLRWSTWRLPGLADFPCSVRHPTTGEAMLLFYCFGKMAQDCVDVYKARTAKHWVREDPYTYGISRDFDPCIVLPDGTERPFVGPDLRRTLEVIYDSMVPHAWAKGDVLVVDNIRWAHARLEGRGEGRRVHFGWYGFPNATIDPMSFARAETSGPFSRLRGERGMQF